LDFGSHLPKQVLEDASSFQLLVSSLCTRVNTIVALTRLNEPKQAAESPTPFLRIGNLYFQGRHETSIGTDILLRPARNNAGDDRGEVGEGEETEEGGMEVFTTTGSHRIVFQPVSIDYAKRLPDLLREGSGMGSMVEEGLAGEGSTENLPIASGSGSLGFGDGAGGSAGSGSATGMTAGLQEPGESGEGRLETLAEGNGGEDVEMQQ
jgi:hypothetical protein